VTDGVPPPDPEALEFARKTLDAQPFSRLLGARLTVFGEGRAVLEIPVRDDFAQQNGFVHGGVLSYAADNALTFAGGSVLGPGVLTTGMTIHYLRPAAGRTLSARAEVLQAGRRQATCRCDLYVVGDDGTEELCAAAQGTVLAARPRP
jgi:uncharacterized protein (TIGR00369 family)